MSKLLKRTYFERIWDSLQRHFKGLQLIESITVVNLIKTIFIQEKHLEMIVFYVLHVFISYFVQFLVTFNFKNSASSWKLLDFFADHKLFCKNSSYSSVFSLVLFHFVHCCRQQFLLLRLTPTDSKSQLWEHVLVNLENTVRSIVQRGVSTNFNHHIFQLSIPCFKLTLILSHTITSQWIKRLLGIYYRSHLQSERSFVIHRILR